MRTSLVIAVVLLCFCNGQAFADNVSTNAVVPGNQGYVYGTSKVDGTAASGNNDFHPIGGIINAVGKLDAWIQRNLW